MQRKKVEVYFYKCPNCGIEKTSWFLEEDGKTGKSLAICFNCDARFELDDAKWYTKTVNAYRCPKCEKFVEAIEENYSSYRLFCPSCNSLVRYSRRNIHPKKLLRATKNQLKRTIELVNELRLLKAENWRDFASLAILLLDAKKEERGFRMSPYSHRQDFTNYLLIKGDEFIGYASWNLLKGTPTLRQIYIVEHERRKGYGSILLRESLKLFAGSEVEFIVESPNEKTLAMLLKLGYVEKDEVGYRGVKVRFIYCG